MVKARIIRMSLKDSSHNSHKDVMRRLIVLICAMIIIAPARRLSATEYMINRLTEPIKLDGDVKEPAWDSIKSLPMTMHMPVFGNEPTVQTDVLLGYDDFYLYVGARCLERGSNGLERISSSVKIRPIRSIDIYKKKTGFSVICT
ncbi:hypothetical protein JXA70_04305 [candidate division KSB1 bacterium]|nr:hypothetical protein [candidate division KSB1 bacterium]